MPPPILYSFTGGDTGPWRVEYVATVVGQPLPVAARLGVVEGEASGSAWTLRGFTSNVRYAEAAEAARLRAVQAAMGRPAAQRAALIPIRKSAAWWDLAQDERRAIFEAESRHIAIGMDYLPAIARRLHHARDLGEPFDFLTWFDFAPDDEPAFDAMLDRLRATPEWRYVEREVDIRLSLAED